MKKFLSILLAVMMVLSTVSFAAPSLAGSVDTAAEVPAVDYVPEEVYEETAELAATAGDKSSYGTLVYSIDFERDDFDVSAFSTAYAKLEGNATAAYLNPDFAFGNVTAFSSDDTSGFSNASLVTEGDNTYITGEVITGYDGFFRMTKYNQAWPTGYYTFSVDVKAAVGQVSTFAQQCNDTNIALTTLSAFNTSNGDWQTVVNQTTNVVNGADMYAFFVTPNNAADGTIAYDNWEVYYRPATVTLTIEGNEYEVSTDAPVSASTLASYVTAPTGYILSGLSLTEGGDLLTGDNYFFEDTTLYPTFEKDPYMSDVYGKALFVVDFENEAAQTWWGHSEYDNSSCSYGAQVWSVATYYDSRFDNQNFRVRFITNEGTHGNQGVATDASGNHYNKGTTLVQWPNLTTSNWGNVTGEPGVYTYVFKRMVSGASSVSSASPAGYTIVDGYDGVQGVWDTVVVQKQLDAAGNIPDGNIQNFTLAAADINVAEIAYDDLYLYYKPLTADVTLVYGGEEYVAEDVSTGGVSADTILAAAGLEIPYGKKAVLSATQGGESVGNVINLVMDSTYYVSFVDDDSISEYGKRLFLVDFENMTVGSVLDDQKVISTYTDNFNGDWSHLTINWEVGTNTIAEDDDGNKFVKGQQGWAQVRINNANYATAPEGYYTMALSVMNFGDDSKSLSTKDQNSGTSATWVKAGSVTGTSDNYSIVNGEWNDVASQLDYAGKDFTIYHTAAMTTDVGFDNVALYYRPASVNLTVVDTDGTETVYENCDSVVDIDTLLADVTAPFGYKAALSVEKNGEPITGTINLVSDAKLYVVLTEDETVSMEYGEALFIIDFENEAAQQWNGCTQEVDNSVDGNGAQVYQVASYYDERFEGKNFRVRFVANEKPWYDQKTVVDANGNHYTSGSNTTKWPQVAQTNWGNVEGKAGYYTYMFDVMSSVAATMTKGSSFDDMPDGFCGEANVWDTVVVTYTMAEDGVLLAPAGGTWANFSFSDLNVATISFDNAKMYWKPFTATVDLLANGAVAATKTKVSTSGVLVSDLVDGVKVKGYAVTGVKLGTETYGLEDTIKVPCDCQLELALEEQDINPATPTTNEEKSMRIDDPTGIRFKAELTKADMTDTTEYGWIVTREKLLTDAGIAAADFTLDSNVKMSRGWNYGNGTETAKIFEQDDEFAWFTAILYFSATEDDGLPSVDKIAGKLVARPFVKNGDEYLYGEPTAPTSMFEIALAIYNDEDKYNELNGNAQVYIEDLLIKADADANDVPDILE